MGVAIAARTFAPIDHVNTTSKSSISRMIPTNAPTGRYCKKP